MNPSYRDSGYQMGHLVTSETPHFEVRVPTLVELVPGKPDDGRKGKGEPQRILEESSFDEREFRNRVLDEDPPEFTSVLSQRQTGRTCRLRRSEKSPETPNPHPTPHRDYEVENDDDFPSRRITGTRS